MASGRSGVGAQQPSFKTDVHRAKTKKWVQAPSYSYDGGDWDGADEYGEYGGYDDPEPAPAQAPAPQSTRQPGPNHPDPRHQVYGGRSQGGYGPGASQPGYIQEARQPGRSGSPGPATYAQDSRGRSGSFARGDERRNFSGSTPLQTAYNTGSRNASPASRAQPMSSFGPYQQGGIQPSRRSMEQQPRMGAAPPPGISPGGRPFPAPESGGRTWSMGSQSSLPFAQRREYSPSGAARAPQPLAASRPPRKSSLSQTAGAPPQVFQEDEPAESVAEPEADQEREEEPRQPAHTSPAPAFIRPADIYKRMAQEKERLSQESSRPSTSDILGAREESSAARSGEESDGGTNQRKHTLDTVAERKSEYGIEGLLSNAAEPVAPKRMSTSPKLPEFEPAGGFGDDFSSFMKSPTSTGTPPREDTAAEQEIARFDGGAREADVAEKTISHQPSVGLRSIVHQAFDEPVTSTTSEGSEIGRSDSDRTSLISPIISRNSSKAEQEARAKGLEIRAMNMDAITEEATVGSLHVDGSLNTPRYMDGKGAPNNEPPASFIPGHRRNISTPSPGNSPARAPRLSIVNVPQTSEEVQFAQVSPSEESNKRASTARASVIQNVVESLSAKAQESSTTGQSSPTRSDSPTKGRVRDLVGKVESAGNSRRGSETSQTGVRPSTERLESFRPQLPGGWNSYVTNEPIPEKSHSQPSSKPPSRPGTSGQAAPSSLPGAAVNPTVLGHGGMAPREIESPDTAKDGLDIEPTTRKRGLTHSEANDTIDPTQEPLAALKAAGSALVDAFGAAAGMESGDQERPSPKTVGGARGQHSSFDGNGINYHPGPLRPLMPSSIDSSTTSILPTPDIESPNHATPDEEIPLVAPLRQKVTAIEQQSSTPSTPTTSATRQGVTVTAEVPSIEDHRSPSFGTSTGTSPVDENDQLRREIVRQLSPNPSTMSEPSVAHSSTPIPSHLETAPKPAPEPTSTNLDSPIVGFHDQEGSPVFRYHEQAAMPAPALAAFQESPAPLSRRFSWEQDSESLNAPTPPREVMPTSQAPVAVEKPAQGLQPPQDEFRRGFIDPPTPVAQIEEPIHETPVASTMPEKTGTRTPPSLRQSETKDPPRLSLETSPRVTPVPPEATRAAAEPETSFSPPSPLLKDELSPLLPSVSTNISQQALSGARKPGQEPEPGQAPIPPFREILAIKSHEERIRVFRSTQDNLAKMNTGLSQWLQMMGQKHPEHAGLLRSGGQFSTPAPGMPGPAHQQHANNAATASAGPSLGGMRKPGATASPVMIEAGAALKSAGRDTKKLAKGLFAKGRSKFGRDKASSKLAPMPIQPIKPAHLQYSQLPVQGAHTFAPDPGPHSPPSSKPSGETTSWEPSVASSQSGLSGKDISENKVAHTAPVLAGPPHEPTSHLQAEPILRSRLTVHQRDMTPFEMSFPDDLIIPEKYKKPPKPEETDPAEEPVSPGAGASTPPRKQELKEERTPKQGDFLINKKTLDLNKALNPGTTVQPAWLNYNTETTSAPAEDFLGHTANAETTANIGRGEEPLASTASAPLSTPGAFSDLSDSRRPSDPAVLNSASRPFSFINFGEMQPQDISLNEAAFQIQRSRESSTVSGPSTSDISRISTHDEQGVDVSRNPQSAASKPLPDLPVSDQFAPSGMPVTDVSSTASPRSAPKMSLFPQTRQRGNTMQGDFGPSASASKAPATMPTDQPAHKRAFSGGKLLQRALTGGFGNTGTPNKGSSDVDVEKTNKMTRRFSNLGLGFLGKQKSMKTQPRGPGPPPPATPRPFEQRPMEATSGSESNQVRPSIHHVAPIEGYYSPEGDATMSPMQSPHGTYGKHIVNPLSQGSSMYSIPNTGVVASQSAYAATQALLRPAPSTPTQSSSKQRAEQSDSSYDRRSLDFFPSPPRQSHDTNRTPRRASTQQTHSPSASVSTTGPRRSRGPSLSVHTNFVSTSPKPTQVGDAKTKSQNLRMRTVSHGSQGGNLVKLDENSSYHHQQPQQQQQPQHELHSYDYDDEVPSDLSALPSMEPHYGNMSSNSATPYTTSASASASASGGGMGRNNKVVLTPAALRIARQREIEMGGDSRFNSPEAGGVGGERSGSGLAPPGFGSRREAEGETTKLTAKASELESAGGIEGSRRDNDSDDEPIVMSATSGPGQAWSPYEHGWC